MKKGRELKILRISKNKKAIEISKIAGISTTKLSLIENDHVVCQQELYQKLVDIINK